MLHHAEKAASHVGEDNPVQVLEFAARGVATQDVCPAVDTTINSMEICPATSCGTCAKNGIMLNGLYITDAVNNVPLTTLPRHNTIKFISNATCRIKMQ